MKIALALAVVILVAVWQWREAKDWATFVATNNCRVVGEERGSVMAPKREVWECGGKRYVR